MSMQPGGFNQIGCPPLLCMKCEPLLSSLQFNWSGSGWTDCDSFNGELDSMPYIDGCARLWVLVGQFGDPFDYIIFTFFFGVQDGYPDGVWTIKFWQQVGGDSYGYFGYGSTDPCEPEGTFTVFSDLTGGNAHGGGCSEIGTVEITSA